MQAGLQGIVRGDEGFRRGIRILLHGFHRLPQQVEHRCIEVVLGGPARTGNGYGVEQHPRRVGGIHEKIVVAQGQLQQRHAQALHEGIARGAGAEIAVELCMQHVEQLEAVVVILDQLHAATECLSGLGQQVLADFGDRVLLRVGAAQALECAEHVVAGQRFTRTFVGAARTQFGQQGATFGQQALQCGESAARRRSETAGTAAGRGMAGIAAVRLSRCAGSTGSGTRSGRGARCRLRG